MSTRYQLAPCRQDDGQCNSVTRRPAAAPDGAKVPISAVSKCTKVRVQHFLLDHHIGACEQCWRHREAEPLSRLKIDCQLNFRGLMNRKLSGLLALKYSPGLNASLPIGIRYAGSIAQQ